MHASRYPEPGEAAEIPGFTGRTFGRWRNLIVSMDDITSEIYSAFFIAEEGTMSSFGAPCEVIGERGRFCSLYADRASHYWHTPDAGGTVDKDQATQVGCGHYKNPVMGRKGGRRVVLTRLDFG